MGRRGLKTGDTDEEEAMQKAPERCAARQILIVHDRAWGNVGACLVLHLGVFCHTIDASGAFTISLCPLEGFRPLLAMSCSRLSSELMMMYTALYRA